MATLKETLSQIMSDYSGRALNGYSYLTSSDDQQIFTVVSIGQVRDKHVVDSGLVVRLVNDFVVIERDVNDKPLVDALLSVGIPREKIILFYAGETAPETV